MKLFSKIKKKAKDGALREIVAELKWVARYAGEYRAAVLAQALFSVLGVVMGLGGSVASRALINAVLGVALAPVWSAAAAMLCLMLGSIGMRALSGRVIAKISVKVKNELEADVFEQIIGADWMALSPYRSGELLNRLHGDTRTVAGSIIGFIPSLLAGLVQFLGALAIMLYYDASMAAIALIGVPVTAILSRALVKRMRRYNAEMRRIDGEMMAFQDEAFSNLQIIKSFGITDLFNSRMREMQDKYRDTYLAYNKFTVYTAACMSLVGMIVSAGCFCWGAYRLWRGAIDYGTMTMFLQLAATLSGAFSSLIGLVPQAISTATSAGRIMTVTELPHEVQKTGGLNTHCGLSVELKEIGFAYEAGKPVLKNVDFIAEAGSIVGVVGISGAGKTTLMRILLGLLRYCGTATLRDGFGSSAAISEGTRAYFSYVPQGNTMFAGTIAENMRMVRADATDAEIVSALTAACAYNEFVAALPDGINSRIGENGKGFSEGQIQRLSIARAVLKDAPILLLDEATSALDMETERRVLERIIRCDTNRTCIVCTHRPGALALCSRVYRIVGSGIKAERN